MTTIFYVSLSVIVCIGIFFWVRLIVRKSIAKQLDLTEVNVLKLVHFGEKDMCRQLKELMVAKTDAKIVEDTINRLPDNRKVPIAKVAVLSTLKAFMADSYIDDVILQEDKSSSKPISFANVDGMFIYNIINNL